jgi:NRPS condensation-like uncharacterized protein
MTFIAALRCDQVNAPFVFDQPINAASFTAWVEQVFAKLQHLLCKAAERSAETTWQRIGSLLDNFPQDECADYLRNSGCYAIKL